ncbi:alpha/beta fold hydrolase [Auraticoccus monumenti]|uniref:alpha/beta fold hydrolase n=1 Tax=Auraticoccus monumenti TaxID=675864 RepID=UPI0018D2DA9B|nr:alpha/beta hydrolase [Auraticoccus monumenti]
MLLLHGGGVAGWMWDPLTARLRPGLRLLVPDLPGHDRSAALAYHSHDATATALERLLEDEARPVAVVGFSLGAQLAVLLAARRPDLVDRVCVVSALARPPRARGATLALVGATAGLAGRDWFARLQGRQLSVPADLLADYVRTSASLSRSTLLASIGENLRFTVPAGWCTFPGRALLLAGSREQRSVRASAEALHRALPHSAVEVVRGSGHDIPLRRPDLLAARLHALLDG